MGASVEAVDQFGNWSNAKIVSKSENTVVVTFPPWRAEWDREICDFSEIRDVTQQETLIPRCFSKMKVRSNINAWVVFIMTTTVS